MASLSFLKLSFKVASTIIIMLPQSSDIFSDMLRKHPGCKKRVQGQCNVHGYNSYCQCHNTTLIKLVCKKQNTDLIIILLLM